jgi:16S rRNA (guanine(527)-N(7))-methyltransferase RsmG
MTVGVSYRELLERHADGAALDRLVRYAELVERWAARHNLVHFASRQELVERHLLDSLAGAHLLEGAGVLLDVGSGAGLPGVPLLAVRPAWSGVLLEPRQKRWAFLRLAVRELGLDARAVDCRYEALDAGERFDLVTSRAVGHHHGLLAWAGGGRLTAGGAVVLWTTEAGEADVAEEPGWRVVSWPLVGLDRGRLVHLKPCST